MCMTMGLSACVWLYIVTGTTKVEYSKHSGLTLETILEMFSDLGDVNNNTQISHRFNLIQHYIPFFVSF